MHSTSKIHVAKTMNRQYLPGLRSQWTHRCPRNSWVQKRGCGLAVQQELAAAPLSRTAWADPAWEPPYCSHQRETKYKVNSSVKLGLKKNLSIFRYCAHLSSIGLKDLISVALAPHTMYPIATRVLESSWLGFCLVELNTVENSVAS